MRNGLVYNVCSIEMSLPFVSTVSVQYAHMKWASLCVHRECPVCSTEISLHFVSIVSVQHAQLKLAFPSSTLWVSSMFNWNERPLSCPSWVSSVLNWNEPPLRVHRECPACSTEMSLPFMFTVSVQHAQLKWASPSCPPWVSSMLNWNEPSLHVHRECPACSTEISLPFVSTVSVQHA